MDSTNSLIVTIGANIEKLRQEVGNAHGVIDAFKEKAVEMGGVIAGAFAFEKIVEFSKESYKAAADYQSDMIRMQYATKGNVQSLNELKEEAEKLANSSWFSGEDLIKQETRLSIMGRNTEQVKGIITAATQMSAALGIDLPTSVDALNKSLNGVGRALIVLDPTFKGLTEEELKNGEAVKVANDKYKDIANQLNGGSAGAMASHKKAVEELSKSYGEFLQPAVDRFYRGLADTMKLLNLVFFDKRPQADVEHLEKLIKLYNVAAGRSDGSIEHAKQMMAIEESMYRVSKEVGKSVLILREGTKSMAFLKPEAVKYVDGTKEGREGKEEPNLRTINGLREKIKQLTERRGDAEGHNLAVINDQIKAYNALLKQLENSTAKTFTPNISGQFPLLPDEVKSKFLADTKDMFTKARAAEANFFSGVQADNKAKMSSITSEIKKNHEDRVNAAISTAQKEQSANVMAAQSMGEAFGNVMTSQQSLAQGLSQISKQIISDMAKRAMAATMAKEAESGPPLVSIALMAAAAAAVSALFSSLGSTTSTPSGGSGISRGAVERYADTGMKPYYANSPMAINLNATLQLSGQNLQALIRQSNYMAKVTGG